jgi:hypothetical protein
MIKNKFICLVMELSPPKNDGNFVLCAKHAMMQFPVIFILVDTPSPKLANKTSKFIPEIVWGHPKIGCMRGLYSLKKKMMMNEIAQN